MQFSDKSLSQRTKTFLGMKLIYRRGIIGACLILAYSVSAFAIGGDYESGEAFSHPDTWPPRLVTLAKLPSRVAGYFVNQDDYLAFKGDTAGFRVCLETCAALREFAPTTLYVHKGKGSFQSLDKAKGRVPCDWQLDVINQSWRAREPNPKGPGYSMELHVWLKGSVDISAVEIPSNVKTIREFDPEGASAAPMASPRSSATLMNESPEVWGAATGGLEMSICPVRSQWTSKEDPEFHVGFRNVGDMDTFLNLGITLANGLRLFPDAVALTLIDPEGRSHPLQAFGPPAVGGRVDDYAVGLQSGAVHVLKMKLSQFRFEDISEGKIDLRPGHYRVAARFDGHGALHKNTGMDWTAWNFWEGTLNSNAAAFDVRD